MVVTVLVSVVMLLVMLLVAVLLVAVLLLAVVLIVVLLVRDEEIVIVVEWGDVVVRENVSDSVDVNVLELTVTVVV